MQKSWQLGWVLWSTCLAGFGSIALAQNGPVTTGGGTVNALPKFTGGATIGNSAITESGGNVAIGVANPLSKLHIAAPSLSELSGTDSTYIGSNLVLEGADTARTVGKGPSLTFAFSTNSNSFWEQARILATPDNTNNGNAAGRLYFQVRDGYNPGIGGTWNWRTGLMIQANGNVGIGTTAPIRALAVYGETSIIPNAMNGSTGYLNISDVAGNNGATEKLIIRGLANSGSLGVKLANIELMSGNVDVDGSMQVHGGGIVYPDGSTQSTAWTGSLCGGDYAESVDVSGDRTKYEPGDVLVIDPKAHGKFLKSVEPYSTLVMGIYSTKPGVTGRRQATPKGEDEVPMAMIGIVPTKVSAENGPIEPGDLLVSSSMPGYAMKGTDRSRMFGAVLGKALGSLDEGKGVIEVGVTLQ